MSPFSWARALWRLVRQSPTRKCWRLNSELSSAQEDLSPVMVDMKDEAESMDLSEGVGEEAPEVTPDGPYWGRLRATKCSWQLMILRKSTCSPHSTGDCS